MGNYKDNYFFEIEELTSFDYNGKNILVVDDNELNLEINLDLLSNAGANVFCADNGIKALNIVEEKGIGFFSFILMDINMPEMDGYSAAKAIRQKNTHTLRKFQ